MALARAARRNVAAALHLKVDGHDLIVART